MTLMANLPCYPICSCGSFC